MCPRTLLTALVLGAVLFLPGRLALGDPAEGTAERQIRGALDEPTEMEFIETPLSDVFHWLKDYHKVEIQIDRRALEDVGIASDEPVTINVKGISLRSALRLMLKQLDLTYTIRDEVLLITTPEEAESQLITEIYVVKDLLSPDNPKGRFPSDGDTLIKLVASIVEPESWEEVGGPGAIAGASFAGVDMLFVSQTQAVHDEVHSLLEHIRSAIDANR